MNEKRTKETSKMAKNDRRDRRVSRDSDRRNRKDTEKVDKQPAKLDSRGRDNDPNWYFLDADVATQASSFSMDQYLGVDTDLSLSIDGQINTLGITVPAILALHMNPCPGDTSTIQRGINMAGLKTYTMLSSMNSKTTNYGPQDVTTLLLSLGEVISILEHIRRAFGVAFTYNQRNRTMPVMLLDMMGFEHTDFLENLAQHRLQFNSWITAVNKIPFLDNIAYMYKCADMYQNVYADSESSMAQLVFMRPYSTWVLDEQYSDQGSGLVTTVLPNLGTWDQWATIVDSMITALFQSTTYNYIYSDILNYSTRTGAKLMYMDFLREDYVVVPVYNRTFMLQVHNSIAVSAPYYTATDGKYTKLNDVIPDVENNRIDYRPAWSNRGSTTTQLIVDFDTPLATLEDRIEATRYQAMLKYKETVAETKIYVPSAVPDHYVVQYVINTSNNTDDPEYAVVNSYLSLMSGTYDEDVLQTQIMCQQVDWAPLFLVVQQGKVAGDGSGTYTYIIGDVNYYTTLDEDWYFRVNDITFQALFNLR